MVRPSVSGQVFDGDGNTVSGAIVTTSDGNQSALTDASGQYRIQVPYSWSGNVIVHAPDIGSEPVRKDFRNLTVDAKFNVRFPLHPVRPGATPGGGDFAMPRRCLSDADCDDGIFCNGAETCDDIRCVAGTRSCAESQVCLEAEGRCVDDAGSTILFVDDNGPEQSGFDAGAPLGSERHPLPSIQLGINIAQPGNAIVVREGAYTSGSTAASVPVIHVPPAKGGTRNNPIVVRAADGERAILFGNGVTQDLVVIEGSFVELDGFELTGAKRTAVDVRGNADTTHDITIRRCYAHDNVGDPNFIGAAFRTLGPVQYVAFEDCISLRNAGGFQLRESPTQTASTALVPPVAGNSGYSEDLPESQWSQWEGWTAIAARYCAIRRCMAMDNRLIPEHSDGFALRYAIECTFEDNIAYGNSDDGFDALGATRCIIRRNIAFDANPDLTADGDGNGFKIGVRGGLDNVVAHNIAFNNPRAGIDLADTERAKCFNNTVFNNGWHGIWSEAVRASVEGIEVVNNLSIGNAKDIGAMGSVAISRADYNAVSDRNDHSAAIPLGPHSRILFDPAFAGPGLTINRSFPVGSSVEARITFIRSQVFQKLGLQPSSAAIDAGVHIPGITENSRGNGPDLGSLDMY